MENIIQENIQSLQLLLQDRKLLHRIEVAIEEVSKALKSGYPVLVFGNGGSAADALHISGELVGKFNIDRRALNVICLNANMAVLTAWSNDFNYESAFARQVEAHAEPGGIAWGMSTSGNSPTVLRALKVSQELGMTTIAMTGSDGGESIKYADILLNVPALNTPRIQELHVMIYHYMCEAIEVKCCS